MDNTQAELGRWVMDIEDAEMFAVDMLTKIRAYREGRANNVRQFPGDLPKRERPPEHG